MISGGIWELGTSWHQIPWSVGLCGVLRGGLVANNTHCKQSSADRLTSGRLSPLYPCLWAGQEIESSQPERGQEDLQRRTLFSMSEWDPGRFLGGQLSPQSSAWAEAGSLEVKDQGVGHVAHSSEQAVGHGWPLSSSPQSSLSFHTTCGPLLLFSRKVVSESWRPHGLQHTRLPCVSPSPRVCTKSCPLSP